jgi:hypothetical protein
MKQRCSSLQRSAHEPLANTTLCRAKEQTLAHCLNRRNYCLRWGWLNLSIAMCSLTPIGVNQSLEKPGDKARWRVCCGSLRQVSKNNPEALDRVHRRSKVTDGGQSSATESL